MSSRLALAFDAGHEIADMLRDRSGTSAAVEVVPHARHDHELAARNGWPPYPCRPRPASADRRRHESPAPGTPRFFSFSLRGGAATIASHLAADAGRIVMARGRSARQHGRAVPRRLRDSRGCRSTRHDLHARARCGPRGCRWRRRRDRRHRFGLGLRQVAASGGRHDGDQALASSPDDWRRQAARSSRPSRRRRYARLREFRARRAAPAASAAMSSSE